MTAKKAACPIVAVGASAGGLASFKRLLGALPPDAPVALVLVQHLDPSVDSQLAELLAQSCTLTVVWAEDGASVETGSVYVLPPGRSAVIERGAIRLSGPEPHCPDAIDLLFTSLAAHNGAAGCAVLLSGSGSDGVQGLREIRGAGGIAFVEDPATAAYGGMPQAAIDADAADFVGDPEAIAAELLRRVVHPYVTAGKAPTAGQQRKDAQALDRILALLHADAGIDFTGYKKTTVTRRVNRRAMLRDAVDLSDYLGILESDPDEVKALADDMLISVTRFFRDEAVFGALQSRAMPELLADKSGGDSLRIWVSGCSTGEEVYSVLITALEAMAGSSTPPQVTVFGTDASERALRTARAGFYPEGICAAVPADVLARHFTKRDGGYEVAKALREMCVFARHDITKDTPFSRIDLMSLRNVLIYMDQEVQKRVLAVAHYSLLPKGLLVLGTSESTESARRLFSTYDSPNHIYRRKDVAARLPLEITGTPQARLGEIGRTGIRARRRLRPQRAGPRACAVDIRPARRRRRRQPPGRPVPRQHIGVPRAAGRQSHVRRAADDATWAPPRPARGTP